MDLHRWKNVLFLQRRMLVAGGAFVTGALAVAIFGGYPLWGNIQTVQINLRQEEQALAKIRQRVNLVRNLEEEDRENFALAAQALPVQKEPLALIRHLQSVSQQADVSLMSYDTSPGLISTESAQTGTSRRSRASRSASSALFIDLETEFAGSFDALRRLVALIEQSRPILEIQTLSLDPERRVVGTGSAQLRYVAKIRLRSYYAIFDPKVLVTGGAQELNRNQLDTLETLKKMSGAELVLFDANALPSGGFTNNDIFGIESEVQPSPVPLLIPAPEEVTETAPEES